MDRKEGIIRLGRSKSPNQSREKKVLPHQRNDSLSTSRNTWERDPLQESMNFNQTFNDSVEMKMNKTETFKGAQTFSGFFPPSPEKVLQRVIIKENIRTPPNIQLTTKSPPNLTNVGRISLKNDNHETIHNFPVTLTERETQLERKVKVLEGRVQELHNEKQASIIHNHEENKKLSVKYQLLESETSNMEKAKNEEIFGLREEVERLRMKQTNLFCSTLTDKEDLTKITSDSALNENYEQRIKFLEQENFSLRESLEEMKLSIMNISAINTQKIDDYEEKISALLEQVNCYKKTSEDSAKIKKELEFCQKSCEDYVSRLLKKSKELTNKEMEYKELEKSLNQALNEGNAFELEEIQKMNSLNLEEKNKELFIVRSECDELRKQLEAKDCLTKSKELEKLNHLTKQINEKEESLEEANRIIGQLEEKIENLSQKPQTVKRESAKSSMKLKSKTYSRAV